MIRVATVLDEVFLEHLKDTCHLESPKRYATLARMLADEGLRERYRVLPARLASEDELALVHSREHIARIAGSQGRRLTSFDVDTQATAGSYRAARLAVGGCLALVDEALTGKLHRGFAPVRPPGHHAEPDRPMGFCLFNNVAVAAAHAVAAHGLRRVLVVDLDLHHGNGTQTAFYRDPRVLYLSFHQFPAYPGTGNFGEVGEGPGEGYTVNVPLGRWLGDLELARLVYFIAGAVARDFAPELILVSCGFDLYKHDPMRGMHVSGRGYALLAKIMLLLAERHCQGRIVFVLEGGYSVRGVQECGLALLNELGGIATADPGLYVQVRDGDPGRLALVRKVGAIQKKYRRIP